MFKHILVPTDGSGLSRQAVAFAISMAKVHGAKITAIHVVAKYHPIMNDGGLFMAPSPALRGHFEKQASERTRKILSTTKRAANAAGVKCDTAAIIGDFPYRSVVAKAKEAKCDLIVMASHGYRGLKGMLLGSETHKVLTHSTVPVLVCR